MKTNRHTALPLQQYFSLHMTSPRYLNYSTALAWQVLTFLHASSSLNTSKLLRTYLLFFVLFFCRPMLSPPTPPKPGRRAALLNRNAAGFSQAQDHVVCGSPKPKVPYNAPFPWTRKWKWGVGVGWGGVGGPPYEMGSLTRTTCVGPRSRRRHPEAPKSRKDSKNPKHGGTWRWGG